jgi:hypothetical protein
MYVCVEMTMKTKKNNNKNGTMQSNNKIKAMARTRQRVNKQEYSIGKKTST